MPAMSQGHFFAGGMISKQHQNVVNVFYSSHTRKIQGPNDKILMRNGRLPRGRKTNDYVNSNTANMTDRPAAGDPQTGK